MFARYAHRFTLQALVVYQRLLKQGARICILSAIEVEESQDATRSLAWIVFESNEVKTASAFGVSPFWISAMPYSRLTSPEVIMEDQSETPVYRHRSPPESGQESCMP